MIHAIRTLLCFALFVSSLARGDGVCEIGVESLAPIFKYSDVPTPQIEDPTAPGYSPALLGRQLRAAQNGGLSSPTAPLRQSAMGTADAQAIEAARIAKADQDYDRRAQYYRNSNLPLPARNRDEAGLPGPTSAKTKATVEKAREAGNGTGRPEPGTASLPEASLRIGNDILDMNDNQTLFVGLGRSSAPFDAAIRIAAPERSRWMPATAAGRLDAQTKEGVIYGYGGVQVRVTDQTPAVFDRVLPTAQQMRDQNITSIALMDTAVSGSGLLAIAKRAKARMDAQGQNVRVKMVAVTSEPKNPDLVANLEVARQLGIEVQLIDVSGSAYNTFNMNNNFIPVRKRNTENPPPPDSLYDQLGYSTKPLRLTDDGVADQIPDRPSFPFRVFSNNVVRWMEQHPNDPQVQRMLLRLDPPAQPPPR